MLRFTLDERPEIYYIASEYIQEWDKENNVPYIRYFGFSGVVILHPNNLEWFKQVVNRRGYRLVKSKYITQEFNYESRPTVEEL